MASLFDGMAGLLADTFGSPVLYIAHGRLPRAVQSVFREEPLEVSDDGDGRAVLIVGPSWRVQRHLVPELRRNDLIRPTNGKTYRIMNDLPSGSPAADGFVICELERHHLP